MACKRKVSLTLCPCGPAVLSCSLYKKLRRSSSKFRLPACRKAERSWKHMEHDSKRPMGVSHCNGLSDWLPVKAPAKGSASHARILCREMLSVPVLPIWPVVSSLGLYQDHEVSPSSQGDGGMTDSLHILVLAESREQARWQVEALVYLPQCLGFKK